MNGYLQVGVREGLLEGLVLAVHLKFGVNPESDRLVQVIQNPQDLERIKALKHAILKANTISELVGVASEQDRIASE